ncbi:MAG TPA: tripartite tricarboxylate transporter TctB family protein [Burkholderiales bacterium]|nr:tripartite tricarboxylate transporter TctB family protein [Burkholderiales bacterium]
MGFGIRSRQDFLAGLLFVFFGAFALVLARNYPLGTAMRMGPGYFPTILGGMLVALGGAVIVRAFVLPGDKLGGVGLMPLLLVLASVALFAVTVERFGIVLSVVLVVFVSSLASGRFRWLEVGLLAAVMVALGVGLFTKGLGLPFKIFPG